MTDVLILGDTGRYPELRHEIPIQIGDPFVYAEVGGRRIAVVWSVEGNRIAVVEPSIEIIAAETFPSDELIRSGIDIYDIAPTQTVEMVESLGITTARVPGAFPVRHADALRAAGIELVPDQRFFDDRRRRKTERELEGIRRATRAAEAGMAAIAELLARSEPADGGRVVEGEPLTCELLRATAMDVFAEHGCRGDDLIVAHGPQAADGHHTGSGRVANDDHLVCDLFPYDVESTCYSDMTRTFAVGEPDPEIATWHEHTREALELARSSIRAGVNGAELNRAVSDFYEGLGYPTSLSKPEGTVLREGFNHGLGHGVGLDVHEAPFLGKVGHDLVVGDVVTLEPGLYRHGFGGVRLEDLVLVTEDGCETLSDYPYGMDPTFGRGGNGRMSDPAISTLLDEERRFPPDPAFAAQANAQPEIYDRDPDEFWEAEGRERVSWFEPFETLSEWELPYAKWYLGGKLNVAYNCVDRHVEAGLGERVAYHWEGEPGETRTITYADLQRDVVRMANALKELGVRKGTPVAIYMGMIPELAVAMLACTRLGAPHTVVFGGFSADSLSGRMVDMGCEVLVTQDEAWRRGKPVALKETADEAMAAAPKVHSCLVVRRTGNDVLMTAGRDHWLHELDVPDDPSTCPCEQMDSEDLLFLMYTSGTTAKPKGIVHTTAGYLVGVAATHDYIFDLKPETDVYWCAADIGWITGHSYIVYGPLCNATTSVLYEGTPDFPDHARWWSIVERYGVTILYTAPTAIRAHMKWGTEHAAKHDLSSLRLLGSVGEPINPEAWIWYSEHIGGGRCPVVDTWWQTETGMIMITPLPGVTTTKPGSATKPFPGVVAGVRGEQGERVEQGGGYLVLERPWPSMTRGIFGDDGRFRATYWERFPGLYFAGDGARIDPDGDFWLLGRVDDVMNVSGHRISTIEVESALVDHPKVAEAAVCGRSDATTGQAIVAYVTLKGSDPGSVEMLEELRDHVSHKIGAIAKPSNIVFTPELPKTRSGKIMRRLLRDVAEHRPLGDTTTLADPAVVNEIAERAAVSPAEDA